MSRTRRLRGERGFSLVETLAALLVFGIVTLGVVPLLMTSLEGSALSRSYTVGKNVALDAMERVRGLPYFISYSSQPTKVDVLDLYFPDLVGNSALKQSYSSGTFTTVCDADTAVNPACPRTLPSGHSVTFVAKFVNPDGTLPTIPPDYAWNAPGNKDLPPSQLLDMSVTSQWTQAGKARRFKLQSLVGDRKIGELKLRGLGRVDYGMQVLTSFVPGDTTIPKSELLVIGGSADSRVEAKAVATADQTARAALLRLTRTATDTTTAVDLGTAEGAVSSYHAPPDQSPTGSTAGPKTVVNSDLEPDLEVSGIDDTLTSNVEVKVANQTPVAKGTFSFQAGTAPLDLWVMTQADTSSTSPLRLDPTQKVFSIRPSSVDSATLKGNTRAETTAVGTLDRKLETAAQVSFKDLRLLPTTGVVTDTKFGGAVVQIDSFTAETTCKATADATTASSVSQWSAVLRHWEDSDPADGLTGGVYREVSLTGSPSGTSDPLAAIKSANPLVYDDPDPAKDVYLFRELDSTGAVKKNGYVADWRSVAKTGGSTSADGRRAAAGIDTAIRIDTAPTNPSRPESGLNISLGKLGCSAQDER